MLIEEFIIYISNFKDVDSILDISENQSDKGRIYERLWDICIKFWFCDTFIKSDYTHLLGNINNGKVKKLTTFIPYISNKVYSGNSSGCSDIALLNNIDGSFVFISSKYPKNKDEITKQNSVDYYDISDIVAVIHHNKHIYKDFKIYLLVHDKKSVLKKVKNANVSSEYITKYMTEENILDKSDLNKCFLRLKEDILKHINKSKKINYDDIYLSQRQNLCLRFHQKLINQKTSSLIEDGYNSFLWGCKCRSGKTYMIGGIIIDQFEIKKKLNVLVITPAPTETVPQFTDNLFNKFKEFENFKIHNIESSKNLLELELDVNNIFIMSKQLLQQYIDDKTILKIKNLKLDIIGFDENHFSGTTDLSKSILDSYSTNNTIKIYLTATYNKPLREWNIDKKCQMYWDIEDEQICKNILIDTKNIDKLKEKHGSDSVNQTIKHFKNQGLFSIEDIFKPYGNMPDLYLITTIFDKERYDIIKDKIMGSKYGFCFDVLFALNKKKTLFQYENEVKIILRYISGSNKEVDFKNGDKSIFSRIFKICSDKESRKPFTQIWFLPSDNINEISTCLEKLMENDTILKNYSVLCINRKNKDLAKDVKEDIIRQQKIAESEGKLGLILLAGNMLTLGITLDMCDIVVLMNNTLSSDKVLQQMYRCMTEGINKKFGFVIDLNISRVINTCINYNVTNNDKSVEDKIRFLIENHLINIDIDMMEQKKLNSNVIISKLMEIWKLDPINTFKNLLRNLDNDYTEFDTSTQKIINNVFLSLTKENNIPTKLEFIDEGDELQDIASGKEKIRDDESIESKKTDSSEKELTISFTKDVLHYIIPLTCILTIKNVNKDFIKMLNDIQENPELLSIFNDMCLTWWNKKNLIDIIKDIVTKYFDKNSNLYNISIIIKMALRSLIDNPKELLELIHECLKPKKNEKRDYGEVFTPMDFINNHMLASLETYYKDRYNKNIYEDETLTWGDTSAGMGNFLIAIYYKLMDGLKHKIVNEKERKKHILEKMLYMAEINKKNCYTINQIFNINNEYKLNLVEGDSLKLDIKKEFGIEKFDIIIGNPPYNEKCKDNNNSYTPPKYNKFTEYYMNKCTLLSFVIPSRWFVKARGLSNFKKMMLSRDDIVYIKHFDDASKIFGKSVSIEGGVNHFLKDSTYKGPCKFNNVMVNLNEYESLIDSKYLSLINNLDEFPKIIDYYRSKGFFKIPLTDKRLHDAATKGDIKCYVSQQNGFNKYIDESTISKNTLGKWQVITPTGNGRNGCFGNIFIGSPNEVYSETYMSFAFDTQSEANSLFSYLKCRLPNMLLSLRKITQNISKDTCKWIPLPSLDREWTDDKIYKYFKMSNEDIKLVNDTKIVGYKNKNSNKPEITNLPSESTSSDSIKKLNVVDLKILAKQKGLKGYSKLKRQELIDLIET